MKKYKKSLIALAAVVAIWVASATGIDKGLIDEFLGALVEDVTAPEEGEALAPAPPEPPAPTVEEPEDPMPVPDALEREREEARRLGQGD